MDWIAEVINFLSNETYSVIAVTILGILFKFLPQFKSWSNEIIPFLGVVVAWLTKVFMPETANAGILDGIVKGVLSPLAPLVLSVVDVSLSKFLHETILRGLATALNVKKP